MLLEEDCRGGLQSPREKETTTVQGWTGGCEMDSSGHFPAKTISNAQEFPCEIQASRKAECLRPLLKLADYNMADLNQRRPSLSLET